jgi:hypothetical protein
VFDIGGRGKMKLMSKFKQPKLTLLLASLFLIIIGVITSLSFWLPSSLNFIPKSFQIIQFLGPGLSGLGCIIFLRSFSIPLPKSLLIIGLPMLVIGATSWFYTPLIIGGNPNNEGAGMLGTLIFIFIGIPGCITLLISIALYGWIRFRKNRPK